MRAASVAALVVALLASDAMASRWSLSALSAGNDPMHQHTDDEPGTPDQDSSEDGPDCKDIGRGSPHALCGLQFLQDIEGDVAENKDKIQEAIKNDCDKFYNPILCEAIQAEIFNGNGLIDSQSTDDICKELQEVVAAHWCHAVAQLKTSSPDKKVLLQATALESALAKRRAASPGMKASSLEDVPFHRNFFYRPFDPPALEDAIRTKSYYGQHRWHKIVPDEEDVVHKDVTHGRDHGRDRSHPTWHDHGRDHGRDRHEHVHVHAHSHPNFANTWD